MRSTKFIFSLGASLAFAAIGACSAPEPAATTTTDPPVGGATVNALRARSMTLVGQGTINPRLLSRFRPLEADPAAATERVELGHKLFFERRLSQTNDIACVSCHDVSRGGAGDTAVSRGTGGREGERNAPTVFNAAGAFAQLWDGRSANVEEQALVPILEAREMGMPSKQAVVKKLRGLDGYRALFDAAFPGESPSLTMTNVGRAIGAYERKLQTPGRWDAYLGGDQSALTTKEKEGLHTFLNAGCMVCHTGPLLGGNMFERVGAVEEWPNQKDTGRMRVTGDARDRLEFKVPTLRNVARTAPYFHDGSVATLKDAVRVMGKHQLGLELTDREIDSIVSWLGALNGDADPALTATPALP